MLEIIQHPVGGFVALALFGLCVGSFLNVVILRLPEMMFRGWRTQCRELLQNDGADDSVQQSEVGHEATDEQAFNLNFPASHCPQCHHPLKWWHNIPVISYVLLGAKCGFCKKTIPWRYPAIELITAVATAHLWMHFGATWQLVAALVLVWSLICLTMIDVDHQLLPDNITLPLVWAGLIANLFGLFTSIDAAVIGAIAGYMGFWIIFQVHFRITGKEGLGYGDFKLLAALGAWLGWELLPMIILFASLIGTIVALILAVFRKFNRDRTISFGPYLAGSGWLALIWGHEISTSYLRLLQF